MPEEQYIEPKGESGAEVAGDEPLIDLSQFSPKGDVLVIAEHILGDLQPVTLELLGAGRILADKMEKNLLCIVLGHNLGEMPRLLIEHGADTVYVADHEELKLYRTLPYRRVICDFLESLPEAPHTALLGSTTTGRDLAPRIAAHFETGLTADTTELDIGPYEHKSKVDPTKIGLYPNCLYAIRPSFGESLKARILGPWKNPQMATTRPGVMVPLPRDSKRKGEIKQVPVNLKEEDFRLKVKDIVREVSKGVKLADAEVIVAGGFGLGTAEGFELLKQLADCFENSAIGASRKVVDLGWIPYQHQVGQTGKTVRPKLYIACGISGAIQHRVGMSKSATIIAVNKDPDAPIFGFADHGIVGDVYQILPELIKQFKAAQDGKDSTQNLDNSGVKAVVGAH
ncbi:MAG: electron transfer flavoprotein subunit alpha/FixB family protein [Cyanobacteria bacterium TGS_CYA1]|nr:electron transfer flavoprotein subunit alpha/FixB family protein [Cyanobacteria bacterium TGS_CYA1]